VRRIGRRSAGLTCAFSAEGTVGAGGKETITSFSVTPANCKPIGNCTQVLSVSAPTFPWSTELLESAGTIRDKIVSVTKNRKKKLGCTGGSSNASLRRHQHRHVQPEREPADRKPAGRQRRLDLQRSVDADGLPLQHQRRRGVLAGRTQALPDQRSDQGQIGHDYRCRKRL
jgi:hypothetical protein